MKNTAERYAENYVEHGGSKPASRLYGYCSAELISILVHQSEDDELYDSIHDPDDMMNMVHQGLNWEHQTKAAATAYAGLVQALATLAAALPNAGDDE